MEYTCLVGHSDMRQFSDMWESHLPAWIIVFCRRGEAKLSLTFRSYTIREGMMSIIPPDMFPVFSDISPDFEVFYYLMDRTFAEQAAYSITAEFIDAIYTRPLTQVDKQMDAWMDILYNVAKDEQNPYRKDILQSLTYSTLLSYFHIWQQTYGKRPSRKGIQNAEFICSKFYNLVFDHYKEHRDTAFYAEKLNITPCYLAMLTRKVSQETPKQLIARMVTLEIKFMLKYTNMTIEEIANELHFPDSSYMCRFFKKQTGLNLTNYRKHG
ncbi:AraC family transcriptional regulator [uncultured Bacteroides sp.]|uniref:helix-turn-helix domain-containing protein n=1 Tax=uncultured Bacteroides sp. TaxID=162156 RepID=UPI00262DA974|nr:helix-turn-helix domain-containing protein [uncultured Bacteroides sp.]